MCGSAILPAKLLLPQNEGENMMRKVFWLWAVVPFLLSSDLPAYKWFRPDGKKADFDDVVKACKKADVVLFGEYHNNAIAHWLQLELAKALYDKNEKLSMGAEMFEADNQLLLDEYLSETISEKRFESEARLWPNYKTDYKPLVHFAREKDLPFVATNIPRRYASMVAAKGLESLNDLSTEAKSYMAPLPVEVDSTLPNYKALKNMGMGPHGNSENFMHAQAIKDATMAHFIHQHLQKKGVFLHLNGAYHSNNFEGISWYLRQLKPDIKIVTISTTEQASLDEYEVPDRELADFVLVTPETMTKTH